MQSVVFRALVPAVQPLPRVSADDTLAPFQATRRDACRPRLPFLAGSALTDSLSSRSVWVFFSTQHRAVLGSWGNTPIHRHRLESDRWLWRVTRDFYSTLLHSRPPHSLSSHKAFQRFRLGTFHFQMLSLLFHLDSVLQEFSFCRGGEKGGKSRTNTHTHTRYKTTRENYTLLRLGSSDLRGWVPSRFLFLFLFLKPESKLASSSRSSRFHAGSLLTCSYCWLVYASPLERPFVF